MKKINHLLTKEGENLTLNEYDVYPRPQLKRESFLSLNGKWELTAEGEKYEIIVPYPPQSLLSGVNKVFSDGATLIYKRSFSLSEGFVRDRVILNVGAIDTCAKIFLNGALAFDGESCFINISVDITELLQLEGENVLEIHTTDTLKGHEMPYGKQSYKRGGMWYTPISGIWQSVWLESVPKDYIKSIKIDTGCDFCTISVEGISEGELLLRVGNRTIFYPFENGEIKLKIDEPIMWSPESPYLYTFEIRGGGDKVESYFALRTIEAKEIDGKKRLLLNGKPYFFHGLLDQGYFSDGIYTPASPDLYRCDVENIKKLGFNTLRKHIKVEPEWFYYECDRQGVIVFQDMVNNGKYSFFHDTLLPTLGFKNLKGLKRSSEQRRQFASYMSKTVKQLYNHPCICYWTIFNEGWGQFEGDGMYSLLRALDSSRIIDTNSGWFGGNASDVESLHVYFKPVKIKKSAKPIVLSEFGGYSQKIDGHVANTKKSYGYKSFKSREALVNGLEKLYLGEIVPQIKDGLCGAIYTQLSDVEDEINGIYTYDRRVLKVDAEKMLNIRKKIDEEMILIQ